MGLLKKQNEIEDEYKERNLKIQLGLTFSDLRFVQHNNGGIEYYKCDNLNISYNPTNGEWLAYM